MHDGINGIMTLIYLNNLFKWPISIKIYLWAQTLNWVLILNLHFFILAWTKLFDVEIAFSVNLSCPFETF